MPRGSNPRRPARASERRISDYFLVAPRGLIERPRRIAIFLIRSGERPVAFTTYSSVLEERANSISRRSSLNDHRGFLAILLVSLRVTGQQSRQAGSPDGLAGVGPDLGEMSGG